MPLGLQISIILGIHQSTLTVDFNRLVKSYVKNEVSVEMVDKCIDCMKKGKAAGIKGLTVEHLMYSRPALVFTFCSGYGQFIKEMHAMMTQFRLIVRLI